jgi:hypothetical protein
VTSVLIDAPSGKCWTIATFTDRVRRGLVQGARRRSEPESARYAEYRFYGRRARALLEPIYRWFYEEAETADLRRARDAQS